MCVEIEALAIEALLQRRRAFHGPSVDDGSGTPWQRLRRCEGYPLYLDAVQGVCDMVTPPVYEGGVWWAARFDARYPAHYEGADRWATDIAALRACALAIEAGAPLHRLTSCWGQIDSLAASAVIVDGDAIATAAAYRRLADSMEGDAGGLSAAFVKALAN